MKMKSQYFLSYNFLNCCKVNILCVQCCQRLTIIVSCLMSTSLSRLLMRKTKSKFFINRDGKQLGTSKMFIKSACGGNLSVLCNVSFPQSIRLYCLVNFRQTSCHSDKTDENEIFPPSTQPESLINLSAVFQIEKCKHIFEGCV